MLEARAMQAKLGNLVAALCAGTGKAIDPQARAAWMVLTAPCPMSHMFGPYEVDPCNGTLRVPHDISAWPDGARRGMLMEAVEALDWYVGDDVVPKPLYSHSPEALADAFLEALEGSRRRM